MHVKIYLIFQLVRGFSACKNIPNVSRAYLTEVLIGSNFFENFFHFFSFFTTNIFKNLFLSAKNKGMRVVKFHY
jgi:hypothetical protein